VSLEEAQKINVATELGRLSLTLRPSGASPAIAKEENLQPVWASDVSPAIGSIKRPPNVVIDPGIQVIRGTKTVQVKLH
jgi:pilus assembly protein CpaB